MRVSVSGVLLAASAAGGAAALAGARPGVSASPAAWRHQIAVDPTGAVGLAASTLLWLLVGLLAVGVVLTVLSHAPGAVGWACNVVATRLLPKALRRSVNLLIGVTVGVGALAPVAASAAVSPASQVTAGAQLALAPAAFPGRDGQGLRGAGLPAATIGSLPSPLPPLGEPAGPVARPKPAAPLPQLAAQPSPAQPAIVAGGRTAPSTSPATTGVRPARGPGRAGRVVVVPGDCLWALAARELAARDAGRVPSDVSIAAEWPRWWAANRVAIGADPALLVPGEALSPPA